jgi:hypothetical protein
MTVAELIAELSKMPPPGWFEDMLDYYAKTGCVRSIDMYHLLGDQSRTVSMAIDGPPPAPEQSRR